MKRITFTIGVIATSIVVYNNIKQLWEGTTSGYDVLAFLIIVLSTILYYEKNKKSIRRK